jgi:hypothetical protein
MPNVAASFPLAGVPGFHSLARTALVGAAGPGGVVLDVYCTCSDEPVAQIVARLSNPKVDEFRFTEMGGGRIALAPALDLRTDHGHFVTDSPWEASPDGWTRLGPINGAKVTALRRALRPAKAVRAAIPKLVAEDRCGCGHEMGFHDPCSRCTCPKFHTTKKGAKAERFKKRS